MTDEDSAADSPLPFQPLALTPIAIFCSPFGTKFGVPRQSGIAQSLEGEIHFLPPFRRPEALRGLETFRFLWLIWGFSGNRVRSSEDGAETCGHAFHPTVRPPRLGGDRALGVFATRSPFRPNPLGLSAVRIASVDDVSMVIRTLGADLMDRTPIYDIKPYVEYADSHPGAGNGFADDAPWKPLLRVEFSERALRDLASPPCLTAAQTASLAEALGQDPRPAYMRRSLSDEAFPDGAESRVFGLEFMGRNVRFSVSGGCLTVLEAMPLQRRSST